METVLTVTFFLGFQQQIISPTNPNNTSISSILLIVNISFLLLLIAAAIWLVVQIKKLNKKSVYKSDKLFKNDNEQKELKTVLYSIGDAVVTTDAEGRIVRMNNIAEQLMGLKEADVQGIDSKLVFTIVNEDENIKYENPIETVLLNGIKIELSNSALLKSKTGLITPISDSASPIINENGKIEGVVLILRDETENRRKKKLLQESEKKFSTIFHSSPEGIMITSLNGEFIDVNEKFVEMTGYSKYDIMGKTTSQLNFWKNIDERKKIIDKIINEKIKHSLEFEFRIKSGELRDGYLSTELIELEKEKVLLSIIQDITERKKADQELRIMNVALANVTESAYLIDMSEGFRYVNEAACKSLGYTKAELLKLKLADIDPGFDMDTKYENLKQIKQQKSPRFETTHRRKNGDSFPVEISSTYFEYNGEELVMSLVQDITERKKSEQELIVSEERFRMLAENSSDVIYKMSLPDGNYEYISPAVTQLTGYTTKEFYDNPDLFKSILHPDFHEYFDEQWKNLLNGKLLPAYEYKIINKSGTEHWCNLRSILSKDENNNPIALEGIVTDVTERKVAELALQELATHNQSLLQLSKKLELAANYDEILDAAFYCVNKIIGYNNLWVYLIDESKEHCLVLVAKGSVSKMILSFDHIATLTIKGDKMLEEIVSQHQIVVVEDARTDERTNKEIVAQLENRTIVNVPIILFNKHLGSAGTGTFGNEGIKIPSKSEKEFLMALASHLAVSLDRVNLQKTKKEAEERIRKLSAGIEQSPASVVITDLLGNVEYVNKKFTEVTGYTIEEIVGKHTRLLKSGDTPPEDYKQMWETILNKKEWRGEFHNKKKNGELYWELASISPIINEVGVVTNFLAVKEDITHIKNMTEDLIAARDKAEEMNKVKSYFYAQMSHELRTPFVGIYGFSELLKEKLTNSEEKEMAEAIYKSSKRLMDTLNKILDITKLEFDKLEPKLTSFNVSKLLTSMKDDYSITAQKQNTFINTKLYQPTLLLKTDERLLTEILTNLISNAVKYTINGLIEIHSAIITKDTGNFLIIKVIDNGIGIPEDKLDLIWDDFRQVSEGFSRTFEGTGLGLSITKKYVKLIGGNIFVESQLGTGTTFTLELPYNEENYKLESGGGVSESISILEKQEDIKKAKILYVEDDVLTILFVKKLLSNLYDLDTAENATAALEKVNQNYYSALLLDINLGKGIDGLKLMQLIREIPFYKTKPIAALTAFATSADKIEFLDKGFSHYVSKPFAAWDLYKLLENMLNK
jgi:PAS domain S-box-containing protein